MQTHPQSQDRTTIGVLYGFRALMVLFVCNYHIWQQGWLGQYAVLFGRTVDLDFWTRSSYVFVDGMMLLSGFLLFLPYARQMADGTPVRDVKQFYWNRLARIVPSYLASVLLILVLIALPGQAYRDQAARNLDILTHLTFTFTFFRETYLHTSLNGALWTIAIEMQFYLVFPLLAKAVRRKPAFTLCAMALTGVLFRVLVARQVSDLSMWVNQLPAFLDVYALGMLGAILYIRLDQALRNAAIGSALRRGTRWITPVLFAVGCWVLTLLLRVQTANGLVSHDQLQQSQWWIRLPLALTLLGMMLSAAFLPRWLQKPLDNRLMRFLATISLNLYIWHQVLSVQVARNLFPDTLHADPMLQKAFTLLCFSLAIVVAMAATWGVEKPAARWMEKWYQKYIMTKEKPHHERSPYVETVPPADPLLVRDEAGRTGAD